MEIDYDEIGNPYSYTHGRDFMWCGRELWEAYLENGDQLQMRYNENGLRSYKRLREDATHESEYFYFWSDDNRLLGYTYDPDMTGTSAFSVTVLYDTENAPIGFSVDDETYYYVKNIQGDVLCVTDVSGAPLAYYTYDAWGNFTFTPDTNATNQQVLHVYTFNPATYRGYYYDNELALYYLQSRYYDPETGRFINSDIYADTRLGVIGTNVFSYCNNNPVCLIDSQGDIPVLLPILELHCSAIDGAINTYIGMRVTRTIRKLWDLSGKVR